MNQSPFSVDSSQINLLKNLDEIDDIFNGIAEDGAQLDQDFEDFLECFSDDEESEDESNYKPFPSFRNVSPSFQLSSFAETDFNKKASEERLLAPSGDHQYPQFEDQNQEDSIEEENELSDFFDSFDINSNPNQKEEEVNYIEIKYFEETYKIPIFTAKLFEPEQPLEDRLLFENTDLVLGKKEMNEFHTYLQKILNHSNRNDYTTFSALIFNRQSEIFKDLFAKFILFKEIQVKWLASVPSVICKEKVDSFCLQLKQFQEAVQYTMDCNSYKITSRRFFDKQKPAYFQDQKKDNKKKEQTEEEKILELQQVPYNQNIYPQSSLVSILFFQAYALYEVFSQFLHYQRNTEKYKEIIKKLLKFRDSVRIIRLLKNDKKIVFVNQTMKSSNRILTITKNELNEENKELKSYCSRYKQLQTMRVKGFKEVLSQKPILMDGYSFIPRRKPIGIPAKNISFKYLEFNQEFF